MERHDMKAEVSGPDDDCDVWLNLSRKAHSTSINLGNPDQPIAHVALEAAGKDADAECHVENQPKRSHEDLTALSNDQLIMRYDSTAPDDPEVDRIANEMQSRGIDL